MDTSQHCSGFVKEHTVSATLVALSHSIRQGPDAHRGAECVLRATYQEREAPVRRPGKKKARKSDRRDTEGSGGAAIRRGEKAEVKVEERRLDLESGGGAQAKIAGRSPLTHGSQGDEGRGRERRGLGGPRRQ